MKEAVEYDPAECPQFPEDGGPDLEHHPLVLAKAGEGKRLVEVRDHLVGHWLVFEDA